MCLRCRQEERLAIRQRRLRLGARIGVLTLGGGALIAVIVGGLTAIAGDARSGSGAAGPVETTEKPASGTKAPRTRPPAPATARTPAPPSATIVPRIAEGRKELGDSVYAVRSGNEVTVNFDTENLRTRFDWKFEGIVRATLPTIYGDEAAVALDSVPSGQLVRGGELLTDLPTRGISLELPRNRSLRIWPVTRPGRDGPIVVAYRAEAEAAR